MTPELEAALEGARHWWDNATPQQRAEMIAAQRESFIRAMGPCEHGNYDWETCSQCLQEFADRRAMEG